MATKSRFSFCLCADDFALSPAVSRGILKTLEARRLTATSVMTTRPSWPQAAKELRSFHESADIGLHLNLTLGAPLSTMPHFAPGGTLPPVRSLISAARRSVLPEAEIRAEIAAQIDAFSQHFGRTPDFVDGHQHVQVLPGIRPWLFDALEAAGLKGKVWLRDSGDKYWAILRRKVEVKKALALAFFAKGFAKDSSARGFQTNRGFAGFSAFGTNGTYAADFARYLVAPGQCHLIMCHPGLVDDELESLDPVTASRSLELEFFLSNDFADCLAAHGANLTRLSTWQRETSPSATLF